MTILKSDNYSGQFENRPSEKFPKGESGAPARKLIDRLSFVLATPLQNGDTIEGPMIPASTLVTDAKISIRSGGATTGIVQFGHKANASGDAADPQAFVPLADAGGQDVLERADADSDGIYKRFDSETQLLLTCTENFDAGAEIIFEVEYTDS